MKNLNSDPGQNVGRAAYLKSSQSGLSLIELMISIVLGMFLMAAALQVMLSSKQSFQLQKESSNIQENARFAVEMLGREIALAGFTGCRANANVANVLNGSGTTAKWEYGSPGIVGFDDSQAASAFPTTFSADRISGTDAVIVRGGAGSSLFAVASYTQPTFQFPTGSTVNTILQNGSIVLASNELCQQVAVFQLNNVAATSATYSTAGTPGNCTLQLGSTGPSTCAALAAVGKAYNAGSNLMPYSVSAFYVAPSAIDATVPALWRARLVTSGGSAQVRKEELLQGVENLQLLYGYDTDATADGKPNFFAKANDAALVGGTWDWSRVVSVRVAILLRSLLPVEQTNQVNANFEGAAVPTDKFARQRLFTTVQLKNLGSN